MTTEFVGVGSDNLGHELKEIVRKRLQELGYAIHDFGVANAAEGDYPDVAEKVAESILSGQCSKAVLVCGTGAGMAISANKVPGVRAVCVTDPYTAERARASNDAQIITLGSLVTTATIALKLVEIWLQASFQPDRSGPKVAKISRIESRFSSRAAGS